jgi:hypothetical protein
METTTLLRILFTALLCLPLLGLSLYFGSRLMDQLMKKPGKQK